MRNPKLWSVVAILSVAGACAKINGAAPGGAASGGDQVAATVDPGWPRDFSKDGQSITVYQPQVDEWKGYAVIRYRAAVAIVPKGAAEAKYGVIEVEAQTTTNQAERSVLMFDEKIEVRFPNLADAESAKLEALVKEALPNRRSLSISLDRVMAYVKDSEPTASAVKVNLDPPPIYFSDKPAVLVIYIGAPEFKPVDGTSLMFAVNTNWDVFLDTKTNRYFLLNGTSWLTSPDPVKGPWTAAPALPQDLSRLPADANWADVRKALPGTPSTAIPTIFASTQPAEMILTEGAPKFSPIPGTSLMYVSNSDNPLFQHNQEKNFYYLVAGRWFRAKALEGPWTAATADLPADFAKIPDDSPMAYVSASVPGTDDAKDAILIASIPKRATINRQEVTVTVAYDGAPKFIAIDGTSLKYAINTSNDVILANGAYYCCFQGVWFLSASPQGPWAVCTSVPKEIYLIPATSPVHNVTYVYVYESTPTTVVVGYTSGYHGQYVANGVIMFGAGIAIGAIIANNADWVHYSHYHMHSGFYSYGCGAVYQGGAFARSAEVYGPYGGAGRAAVYNPSTGAWGRSAYVYGPSGGAFARQGFNPHTGVYAAQAGGSNQYGSWSRGVVSKGDDWIAGGRNSNGNGTVGWVENSNGRAAVGARGENGNAGIVGNQGGAIIKTEGGDIYAGKDGNVYKRQDGEWQSNTGSGWSPPVRATPTGTATPPVGGGAGTPRPAVGGGTTTPPAVGGTPRGGTPPAPAQLPANLSRDATARTTGNARAARPAPAPAARTPSGGRRGR